MILSIRNIHLIYEEVGLDETGSEESGGLLMKLN